MIPSQEDILEAFDDASNILDKKLSIYHCDIIENVGMRVPAIYSGGTFCTTVPLKQDKENFYTQCLRIWHASLSDMKERSNIVSQALRKSKLSYFVDYEYLDQALRVNGQIVPGIRMKWIGQPTRTLTDFLRENPTSRMLKIVGQKFLVMCSDMRKSGFAHGDLSSTNILVTENGDLILIDYDSMYVPEMGNRYKQEIAGTAGYQHPKRKAERVMAGPNNDNFSQIIIYLQLLAFAKQPSLCKKIDDKVLLFNDTDLVSKLAFCSSPSYKTISALGDEEIQFYLDEIANAIDQELDEVKSLCDLTPPSKNRQSESPKPVDDKYRRERVDTLNTQQRVSKEPKKVDGKYRYEIPKSLHIPVGKKGERCVFCNFIISNGYPQANNCPNCGAPRVTYKIAEKI